MVRGGWEVVVVEILMGEACTLAVSVLPPLRCVDVP
jgi:hypothetical protein